MPPARIPSSPPDGAALAPNPVRRRVLAGGLALGTAALGGCMRHSHWAPPTGLAPSIALRFLGACALPADLEVGATRVGGLSGLDYDAARDRWLFISDDHRGTPPARWYEGEVRYAQGRLRVDIDGPIFLQTPEGLPMPKNASDTESLRLGSDGDLFIASEGRKGRDIQPWIRAYDDAGRFRREFTLPAHWRFGKRSGPRFNQVVEGMDLTPDGRSLYAVTEDPIYEDGPGPGIDRPAWVRITRFAVATGQPLAQNAYALAPLPDSAWLGITGRFATNGVSELLVLSEQRLLLLERAYAVGAGFTCRLFEAALDGATEVSRIASLTQARFVAASKHLLLTLGGAGITPDNYEGMALGPMLATGEQLLVICSDNNFGRRRPSRFLAFAVRRL